jgi:hypothetical protein
VGAAVSNEPIGKSLETDLNNPPRKSTITADHSLHVELIWNFSEKRTLIYEPWGASYAFGFMPDSVSKLDPVGRGENPRIF